MASTEPPRQPRRHRRADYVARHSRHRAGVASNGVQTIDSCTASRGEEERGELAAHLCLFFLLRRRARGCRPANDESRRYTPWIAVLPHPTPSTRCSRIRLAATARHRRDRHGTPSPRRSIRTPFRGRAARTCSLQQHSLCKSSANWPLGFVCKRRGLQRFMWSECAAMRLLTTRLCTRSLCNRQSVKAVRAGCVCLRARPPGSPTHVVWLQRRSERAEHGCAG